MNTLVSVIISTYNSSIFIEEALNSITAQTWANIELIVTDDCSTDDTIELCTQWLTENSHRFINAIILTSLINNGVSANANRGLRVAKGDWIKFLGADDTLKPDCIENNMSWIATHPEVKVLFSRIDIYKDTFEPNNFLESTPDDPFNLNGIMAPGRTAGSQYKMLLICDRIHFTPSVFLHRETLLSLGGFDERFKFLEDYPLWLKLTGNGHKLYFMDKGTVNYRRHSKAINNTGISHIVNPNYFRSEEFCRIYTYAYLPADVRLSQRFTWYASQIFRNKWFNRDKKSRRFLFSLLTIYLNPFRYYIWIRKSFNRELGKDEFYM